MNVSGGREGGFYYTDKVQIDMHSWRPSMEEENGLSVLMRGGDKQDMESR